jgi:hypothetical protein
MTDDVVEQRKALNRAVAHLKVMSDPVIGSVSPIEYMGISFHVSPRFVIADLPPLSFFHLVEHIDDDPGDAVLQLYDRLIPLLSCRHEWTALKRRSDERIRKMGNRKSNGSASAHICKSCMAYALGGKLPTIGTSFS